jgi:hypothetical protein
LSHLVNANLFRLGHSIKWLTTSVTKTKLYKTYLQTDLIIFRFIKAFFRDYSIPIFTWRKNRTKRGEKNNRISGLTNLISNEFIENTFIFSHVNISRSHILGISCYFMDTLMDEWRQSFLHSVKNASITFFQPTEQPYKRFTCLTDAGYFPKFYRQTNKFRKTTQYLKEHSYLIKKGTSKWQDPTFEYEAQRFELDRIFKGLKPDFRTMKQRRLDHVTWRLKVMKQMIRDNDNSNILGKNTKIKGFGSFGIGKPGGPTQITTHLTNRQRSKLKRKFTTIEDLFGSFARGKFYPTMLYDKEFENQYFQVKNRFKLLKICLLLFKQKISCWKQQQFFVILLKNLLLSILRFKKFKCPFFIYKLLNSIIIREFSFKHLNFYYFQQIFFGRFIIFQGAGSAIYFSLKEFDKNEKILINFFGLHTRNITASL